MKKKPYGRTTDGKAVDLYTLSNASGASVDLINYGATITRVMVPDKNGKLADVVLGFDDLAGYESRDNPYFGCTVGRVANRIAHGTYTVDGKQYHCATNNGSHTLHGGLTGYDKRIWDAEEASAPDGPSVRFSLIDPDGTEGFPGTVKASVTFTFTDAGVLRIEYSATTNKTTPISLTNHSYWNLKDAGRTVIYGHILKAYADRYIPVDETQIPTGEIAAVKGTAIDFTLPKPIGQDLQAMGGNPVGYDHNFALNNQSRQLAKAVEVYEPTTGRVMQVWTNEPGLQFYSGNFLCGAFKGKAGISYAMHSAFAFEAQTYPDAINRPNFPTCILKPDETYHQVTEYRLGASATQPM